MVPDRCSTLTRVAAAALALSASVSAVPAGRIQARDGLGFFDDVLLFDAPGVSSNPPRAEIQAYTYVRQFDINLGPIDDVLSQILNGIPGLGNLDDYADRIAERTKLFLSVPRTGKEVNLTIDGCDDFTLRPTSKEVDGISITPVTCKTAFKANPVTAAVDLESRGPKAKIFVSPPDGFGVISDLDDTIKISNVLDKVQLVKNTFIEDPKPVSGMPELYRSLKARLSNPLFSYISGSPFQLYPFIRDFLSANYPGGPAFLRNITVFDIPNLVETLTDSQNTFKSKLVAIDRLVKLYPAKKFLMIGDSTEQDPEIYAEAFKRYPNSVQCIWIRAVEGANNAPTRWKTAFSSVPGAKVRVFTDAQIGGLKDLDVPNGKC